MALSSLDYRHTAEEFATILSNICLCEPTLWMLVKLWFSHEKTSQQSLNAGTSSCVFLKDISEGTAGQVAELRVVDQHLEEWLLERLSGNDPQFLPVASFVSLPTTTHRSARDKELKYRLHECCSICQIKSQTWMPHFWEAAFFLKLQESQYYLKFSRANSFKETGATVSSPWTGLGISEALLLSCFGLRFSWRVRSNLPVKPQEGVIWRALTELVHLSLHRLKSAQWKTFMSVKIFCSLVKSLPLKQH